MVVKISSTFFGTLVNRYLEVYRFKCTSNIPLCSLILDVLPVLSQIVNRHGPEADRHLLRCLFSHVDFSGDGKSSGKDFHQVIFG